MKMSHDSFHDSLERNLRAAGSRLGLVPAHATVFLTNKCNARCRHCYSWKLKPNPAELEWEEWKEGLTCLRKLIGPVRLSLTGGEALTRPFAVDLIEHALRIGFDVVLFTNGYRLNEADISERLISAGLHRFIFSLDGSTEEIHDGVRRSPGLFRQAVDAMTRLVHARETKRLNLIVVVTATIMQPNVEDLPNIAVLARNLGISGVRYHVLKPVFYLPSGPDWYRKCDLFVSDTGILNASLVKIIRMKAEGYPVLNTLEQLHLVKAYFADPSGIVPELINVSDDPAVARGMENLKQQVKNLRSLLERTASWLSIDNKNVAQFLDAAKKILAPSSAASAESATPSVASIRRLALQNLPLGIFCPCWDNGIQVLPDGAIRLCGLMESMWNIKTSETGGRLVPDLNSCQGCMWAREWENARGIENHFETSAHSCDRTSYQLVSEDDDNKPEPPETPSLPEWHAETSEMLHHLGAAKGLNGFHLQEIGKGPRDSLRTLWVRKDTQIEIFIEEKTQGNRYYITGDRFAVFHGSTSPPDTENKRRLMINLLDLIEQKPG